MEQYSGRMPLHRSPDAANAAFFHSFSSKKCVWKEAVREYKRGEGICLP